MEKKVYNCRFCGRPITEMPGHRYCYGCVVDDIYNTLASGGHVIANQITRARYKDIDISEIRMAVIEDQKGRLHA